MLCAHSRRLCVLVFHIYHMHTSSVMCAFKAPLRTSISHLPHTYIKAPNAAGDSNDHDHGDHDDARGEQCACPIALCFVSAGAPENSRRPMTAPSDAARLSAAAGASNRSFFFARISYTTWQRERERECVCVCVCRVHVCMPLRLYMLAHAHTCIHINTCKTPTHTPTYRGSHELKRVA